MKLNTNQFAFAQFVASTLLSTIFAFGTFGALQVLTDLRKQSETQAGHGPGAAPGDLRSDRGKGIGDKFEQTPREMAAIENKSRAERRNATIRGAQLTSAFMAAGWVVSLAIAASAFLLVGRESARRETPRNHGVREDELQSQYRLISAILEQMADGVVVADEAGRFITFNQAAQSIIGLGPLSVTSCDWSDRYGLFLPDAITPFPADQIPLARAMRGESSDGVELFVRHSERPEGRWISVNARPLLHENGMPRGGVAVFRDTTELKRAEICLERSLSELKDRVREQTAELEALMEAVPAIVWIAHDPECRRITGNRAGNEFLRIGAGGNASVTAPGGEQPTHFRVFHDGVEPPPAELPVQLAARGIEVFGCEQDVVFDDGTTFCLYGNARPLYDDLGDPCGAVSAFINISSRRQAEADLRASEQRYRELADAMPQIIWTAGPDGAIDYRNQRWFEITGHRYTPGAEESWNELIHPDDRTNCRDGWAQSVRSGSLHDVEYRLFHQNTGQYRWHLGRAVPVRDELGKVARWIGTSTDIDDLKRAQEALRDSEARLTLALDTAQMGIWDWEVQAGRLDWSPQYLRLFGFSDGEFNNDYDGFRRRVHPADIDELERRNAWMLKSDDNLNWAFRVVWPDGSVHWIEAVGGVVARDLGEATRVIGTAVDITARKLAEEELWQAREGLERRVRERTAELEIANRSLRESERLFRVIFDQTFQFIILLSADGAILEANQTALDFGGITRDQVVGQPIWESRLWSIDPEIQQRLRDLVGAAASGDVVRHEFDVRGADAWVATIDFSLKPLPDDDGNVSIVLAAGHDITERIRADRKFRGLVECAPDAKVIADQGGKIVLVNSRTENLFGYSRAELLGQPVEALIPHRFRAKPSDHPDGYFASHRARPMGTNLELLGMRKDGSEFLVEISLSPLETEEGMLVISSIRDVTERKRAEVELARINSALRRQARLIDVAHEAILIRTIEGEISFWNQGAERLYGWSKEEALGRSSHEFLNTRFPAPFETVMEELVTSGSWEGEIVHERADGSNLVVSSRWVIDRERWETDSAVLEMNNDITERRRAEAEAARERHRLSESVDELVRAREAALENSRLKSEFLANMSHEIRTPMNGVIGMTSLLCETDLDAEQRDYVMTIRDSGQALMSIINDVLDFSKIESGKLNLEFEEFNLRTIIEDVAELMAPTAHQKHLEIACDFPAALLEWYEGDGGRIRQVLLNLVSNAVKFTARGDVILSVRLMERSAGQSTLRLAVKDTGIGIAPDRQEVIFESFTQADGRISRRYGGTDLGLSICRRLAELMGGYIGLESTPGQGSEFWFVLNLRESSKDEGQIRHDAGALQGRRVIVAVRHATARSILKAQVESWGCRGAEASDAADVFALLRFTSDADPFAVVFLDEQLPGNTRRLIEAIAANPQLTRLPIVLLQDGVSRAVERAMDRVTVLTKPVRLSTLYNLLVELLQSGSKCTPVAPVGSHLRTRTSVLDGVRVLVAEDNTTNQKVAMRMLERLGCHADAVFNGLEALNMLNHFTYNVVLMDVQMPEMDGLSATAEIRRREKGDGRRLPVIAMTAHAMRGDRERCMAAGMDDYLSKPVTHDGIVEVLERWCSPMVEPRRIANPEGQATQARAALFRFERLREVSRGDSSCERGLLRVFLDDAIAAQSEVRAAFGESDPARVSAAAHGLAGACCTLGADSMAAFCRELEVTTRGERLPPGERVLAEFEREYQSVRAAIIAYLDSLGDSSL